MGLVSFEHGWRTEHRGRRAVPSANGIFFDGGIERVERLTNSERVADGRGIDLVSGTGYH